MLFNVRIHSRLVLNLKILISHLFMGLKSQTSVLPNKDITHFHVFYSFNMHSESMYKLALTEYFNLAVRKLYGAYIEMFIRPLSINAVL